MKKNQKNQSHAIYFAFAILLGLISSCGNRWTSTESGDIVTIVNRGGETLKYSKKSGIKILTFERYAFKDLNKNGKHDRYEDWRLPYAERAQDLASKLSIEQIAGLMLYSAHQQQLINNIISNGNNNLSSKVQASTTETTTIMWSINFQFISFVSLAFIQQKYIVALFCSLILIYHSFM